MNKLNFKEDLEYCLNLIEKKIFINKIIIELERIEGLDYYKIYLFKPFTKALKYSEGDISKEEIIKIDYFKLNKIESVLFNFLKTNKKNFYKKFTLDV